jgi:hypothetical protein
MKKIVLLFAICGGLFMASCTKQYTQVEPNQTVYADLTPSNWTTTSSGTADSVLINTPVIDQYFTDHGGIDVYFTFDNGNSYEQIPEVYNSISFSYVYTAGGVILYAQNANGTLPASAPTALTAKIVLIPSN